ncbi:MAG: response regulator [Alphaproteobacteria bacterium]
MNAEIPNDKLRVLMVDDQAFIRMTLRQILGVLGIVQIEEASDGVEALEYLHNQHFDIVILDIQMEPMDGLECLKKIRRDPEKKIADTPVVMLTTYSDESTVKKVAEIGVQGYIVKPTSVALVGKAIERALGKPG